MPFFYMHRFICSFFICLLLFFILSFFFNAMTPIPFIILLFFFVSIHQYKISYIQIYTFNIKDISISFFILKKTQLQVQPRSILIYFFIQRGNSSGTARSTNMTERGILVLWCRLIRPLAKCSSSNLSKNRFAYRHVNMLFFK